MSSARTIGLITATALVLLSIEQFALAEGGTQCHDLPAKKAVLEQGREFLRTQSAPSREIRHAPLDNKPWDRSAPNLSEAQFREHLQGWVSKYSEPAKNNNPSEKGAALQRAEALETLNRVKIVNGLSSGDNFDFFREQWRFGPQESYYYNPISRDVLINSVKQTLLSKQDWQSIESTNEAATVLRKQFGSTRGLAFDLLMSGALSERKGARSDAYSFFLEAGKLDKTTLTTFAAFLYRNPSILKNAEKDFDQLVLTAPADHASLIFIWTMIQLYISDSQNDKAIAMYEKYCSFPATKVPLSTEVILSLIAVLPERDLPSLHSYIADISDTEPFYAPTFVTCMIKLKARGWTHEPDAICDTILVTERYNTPKQLAIMRWYAESKNAPRFVSFAKASLTAMKNDSDELAMGYLAQMQKLLSSMASDRADYNEVASETKRVIAYREDQIRRKQCLNMAQQLDKTAFDLEKSNQPEMASKLYTESLKIKQANLAINDPETAMQLVDLARTAAAQHQYAESERQFEKALSMMRKNSHTDPDSLISALESYGMMLNDNKKEAKASAAYDEAKQLHSNMKKTNLHDEILKW